MQHGLAVSKTENPERPLSEEGIKQTRLMAGQLLNSKVAVSAIFHSGKLRARQTADIFAAVLNIKQLAAADYLSPNVDAALTTRQLTVEQALHVGHLPHLEKLVSTLVTGKDVPTVMKFQNSAVVCLEKNSGSYHISWYITPQLASGESS